MGRGAANRQSVWKSGRYHIQSSPGEPALTDVEGGDPD